jgi:hypothetical protein
LWGRPFHWEQKMGNMITSLWGRPFHWEHKMGNMITSLWGRPFLLVLHG